MIIVMRPDATQQQVAAVSDTVVNLGLTPRVSPGQEQTVINVLGKVAPHHREQVAKLDGVEHVEPISKTYRSIARQHGKTVLPYRTVKVGRHQIGNGNHLIIAGPCSVNSLFQMRRNVSLLLEAGAQVIRAGAFKPRSSIYDFQGLGVDGLRILKQIAEEFNVGIATEATGVYRYPIDGNGNNPLSPQAAADALKERIEVLNMVMAIADLPWIGALNGTSNDFIRHAALLAISLGKPLMLKRHPGSTIDDYLNRLEVVQSLGCDVIACLRGVSNGGHKFFRNIPDITDIIILKQETTIPVLSDLSHMAGRAIYVEPLARAAVELGTDGLIIESSYHPQQEWTDSAQTIEIDSLARIIEFATNRWERDGQQSAVA